MLKKILLCSALLCASMHANTYTTVASLADIPFDKVATPESTLVVFDVDEVLISTIDHFSHPYADDICDAIINNAFEKATTAAEIANLNEAISICFLETKRSLVEESAPKFLSDLKSQNYKLIALTSLATGKFGRIENVEKWREDSLQALGISFADAFPELDAYAFTEIARKNRSLPTHRAGILFSGGYNKGDVLKAFFEYANYYPKTVIFIDDREKNLKNVEETLSTLGIAFQGYQFTGASRFFRDEASCEMLSYQFNHLIDHKKWLSDAEAEKHLQDSSK